jgi:hypothetical protein
MSPFLKSHAFRALFAIPSLGRVLDAMAQRCQVFHTDVTCDTDCLIALSYYIPRNLLVETVDANADFGLFPRDGYHTLRGAGFGQQST